MVEEFATLHAASSLDGQVALVTGGARGIGAAIAIRLQQLGARVVITSRDLGRAESVAGKLGMVPRALDVRDVASVSQCVTSTIDSEGQLDILINNAGVNQLGPSLKVDEGTWDRIVDTNLKGPFFMSQAAAAHMVAAGCRGTIVNVSSQAGVVALNERAPYCASKAALIMLTKAMALELAPHRITVNAVAPTYVETDLTAESLSSPETRSEILAKIPLGRLAEPGEVADAVAYLVSPGSKLVTGHTLVIDGGWTIS